MVSGLNEFKDCLGSFLLVSKAKLSSSYNRHLSSTSFEREEKPYGSNVALTLLRGSDLGTSYEWQCSRKCSIPSTPSFEGQRGFTASLKYAWICESLIYVDIPVVE